MACEDCLQCGQYGSHLLVAPLHAAVPLKEVDCVVVHVCKDLDLDVPRPLDEALQQHAIIAKGGSRLSLR